jgi:hypothetical protein
VRLALPGAHPEVQPAQRFITLYSTQGWVRGAPEGDDGNLPALMRGLRRAGVRGVISCCGLERPEAGVDGGAERADFNTVGLLVLAREAGLKYAEKEDDLGQRDVFLTVYPPLNGPAPCQRLRDGTGIYAILGNPIGRPQAHYTYICPGRTPAVSGYQAGSVQLPGAAR